MLTHNSPVDSANNLADYINANVAAFPSHLNTKAIEAVREASPVVRMALGIEVVFAVVLANDAPNREAGLNALGSSAMQVAEGGFWGKGDRALALVKWTRAELGEWPDGLDAPAVPEIDASLIPADPAPALAYEPPATPNLEPEPAPPAETPQTAGAES